MAKMSPTKDAVTVVASQLILSIIIAQEKRH